MRTHSASHSDRQARLSASPDTAPQHQFSNTMTTTTTSPTLLEERSFPTLHSSHATAQPSQSLTGGWAAPRHGPHLPPTAFSASTVAALSASIATTASASSSAAAPTVPPHGGGVPKGYRTLPAPSPEAITSIARSLAQSMGDAMQGNMLRLLPPTPTASCSGHVNDSSGGWADATSASPIQQSATHGVGGGEGGLPLSAERTAAALARSAGAAAVARQRALYDMESMADPAELPFTFASGGEHSSPSGVEAALEAQAAAAAAAAAALAAAVQRTRQQQALSAQQQSQYDAHSLWNPEGHSPDTRGRQATGSSYGPQVSSSSSRPGRDQQGCNSSSTVAGGGSSALGEPASTAAELRMLAAHRLQQLGLAVPAGGSLRAGPPSEGANRYANGGGAATTVRAARRSLSPALQTVRAPPSVPVTPPAYKDWTPVDQSLASQTKPRPPPANVSPAWVPPGGTANIPAKAASPLNSTGGGLNISRSSMSYVHFPAAQYAQSESGGVPTRRSIGSGILSSANARNAAASQAAELSTPVRRSTSHLSNLPASTRYTTPYLMMLQTLKPGTPHEGVTSGGSILQGATNTPQGGGSSTPQGGVRARHSLGGNEGEISMSPVTAGSDQRKSSRRTFYSSGIGAAITYDSFDAM